MTECRICSYKKCNERCAHGELYCIYHLLFKKKQHIKKERKCLKCSKEFVSKHIGNRLCNLCKQSEVFSSSNTEGGTSSWRLNYHD